MMNPVKQIRFDLQLDKMNPTIMSTKARSGTVCTGTAS